jgi:hypothetical protein
MGRFPKIAPEIIPARRSRALFRDWGLWWQCLQLAAGLVYAITTPVILLILQQYSFLNGAVIAGHACDLLVAADAVRLRFGLPRFSRKRYWKKRNLKRIYSSIIIASPIVLVPLIWALGASPSSLTWTILPRLICLFSIPSSYRAIKRICQEKAIFLHETYIRVILTLVFVAIHASFLSSLWFYIACRSEPMSDCLMRDTWVAHDTVLNLSDPVSRYARSMHFVVQTLFTIGYGDIQPRTYPETLFTLFLILNGSLFYAFLISSISSLLSNRDATTKLFRSETNRTKAYFSDRGVTSDLSEQVQGFFEFLYSRKSGVADSLVFSALPPSLSCAIKECFVSHLESVPFFSSIALSPSIRGISGKQIILACCRQLTLQTYVPGSYILRQGEKSKMLLIVIFGRIEIKVEGSKCALMTLLEGDHIGGESLFLNNPWSVSLLVPEYAEVLMLNVDSLCSALCEIGLVQPGFGVDNDKLFNEWLACDFNKEAMLATISAQEEFCRKCRVVQANINNTYQKKKMMDMLETINSG